jgi:hypothetical protein
VEMSRAVKEANVVAVAAESAVPAVRGSTVNPGNTLATRRRFLAGLFAGAGSLALAACGGGGGSDPISGGASATANAAKSQRAQAASLSGESASGTTIPSATSITDANGVQWTLSGGAVLRAGVNSGCPVLVSMLLYYNHTIYGWDASGLWYVYQNNAWNKSHDPRESVSGLTMPPASAMTDANGSAWSLSGGAVLRDGAQTYCPVLVSMLLYWNHAVYAWDASGLWYIYQNNAWLTSNDPRESTQGTTVPPAKAITDNASAVWTLSNGAVLRAGAQTWCPVLVSMLLYWNHAVYAWDASGLWYVYQNNGWAATSDPRNAGTPAAATSLFFGMNGHMAWNSTAYQTLTPAQQVAILKDLGVTNYRVDVADAGMAQTVQKALTGAFKGSGVSILPCINPMNYDQTASESTAYNYGYQLAVSIITPLKGLVSHVECGNELDANGLISNGAGNSPSNYNTAYWPAFRGVLRGMIDGVKSVDSSIKCGINVGVPLAYTALQMLWNGQSPNGTATAVSNATPLRWDITMFHWYETSGDIVRAGSQGLTNVLQILQTFGLPIWLTEWGYYTGDTPAAQATYVANTLKEYYSLRQTYNLQSVMMYQLIDTPGGDVFGVLAADGVTKKTSYAAYKNFTAANPA